MSISYLKKIEELESIAAQLKRDTELTRNLVGIATAERDSLVAQVVTLRKAVAEAKQVVGFLSHHLRGRMAEAAIIDMAEKADSWAVILNQSPAACLAQVRAEAGRAGFVAGAEWWAKCELEDTLHLDEQSAADRWAESIWKGGLE
jgi:hypothetical protein